MLRIGLTGGIGSGKTTVAKIFEVLGVPVFYADDEAKKLINTNPEIKKKIIKEFGPGSYTPEGLNRPFISSRVFNNKEKLDLLNSLTHPATIEHARQWMVEKQEAGFAYVLKEAALIFESGSQTGLDKVIGVAAPEEIRILRVLNRDKTSREEVLRIMGLQMNEEEKINKCDFVIHNDGEQLLIPQVIELHEKLLQFSGKFPV